MTPELYKRLWTLFDEAQNRRAGDRQAFLDEQCAAEPALRGEVEKLLAQAEKGTLNLLAKPSPMAVKAQFAAPEDAVATVIGTSAPTSAEAPPVSSERYELGEEIARGGMGVVYRATDVAFGREVAVKVLQDKFGAASGPARRFDDEARITGQLQHPAIPPVHDLGTLTDGRPFLAMKLIKGDNLDDLLKGRTNPSVERGRFVAVFEQVCQAVAYAHAHQVIHRDLKPANVMVGNFGEVQVMDWGLAKVLGLRNADSTDPDETTSGTAIQSMRESDSSFTQAGSVLGTPAYMPPEQAIGAINKVDARSDVFGLGAILAVILTGKPPFAANSVETTRLQAAQGNVEECFARLDASGAEPELVSLCKRCLRKKPEDRPADAGEVAKAVAELRAAADERARQAELDRVKAEGDKATAEAKTVEQRKRRRVQLALAGFVVLVAVGGGIAASWVQSQREADRLAAEKQRTNDQLAAEKQRASDQIAAEAKRLNDLRTADEKRATDLKVADEDAKRAQRETRAGSLVEGLGVADTAVVPTLLTTLAEFHDLTGPQLRELAKQPATAKPGLHARLALLAEEPARVGELVGYLPMCKPEELLPIRRLLKPHAAAVVPPLWPVLTDATEESGKRVRAACVLAELTPIDARWKTVAAAVTDAVVRATPGEFVVWSQALDPIRESLLPALVRRYPESRGLIRSGKLSESELVAEASGFDLTVNLLARYAGDRPTELAELAMTVDARHHWLLGPAIAKNRAAVVPILRAELGKEAFPGGLVGPALAAAVGVPVSMSALDPDPVFDSLAKRQANAAAVLLALGESEVVWPLFRFPADGDPSVRSYLTERVAGIGVDPVVLIRRFRAERETSAKRALLIALGDFPTSPVWTVERESLAGELLVLYREHPDAGLHGAIDWLLRQKWGKSADLARIDGELAAGMRGRVAARAVAGGAPLPLFAGVPGAAIAPMLPAPVVGRDRDWFVNGEGQTYAVVRGPVEFTLGSPGTEPGRLPVNEPSHKKRIGRSFAIATKEVTMEEFLLFRPGHDWTKRFNPDRDGPAAEMTWYDATAYCNWLSEREGIPVDQWCYEPTKGGAYGPGMRIKPAHLKLTGYRLPTEVEWEYACRSGSVTSRYYGRSEELLTRYGWYRKNAEDRAWPGGRLRPNELGLFDMLGNAVEWVEDPGLLYITGQIEEREYNIFNKIDENSNRSLRGGSFSSTPVSLRGAYRNHLQPTVRYVSVGFRPTRTFFD